MNRLFHSRCRLVLILSVLLCTGQAIWAAPVRSPSARSLAGGPLGLHPCQQVHALCGHLSRPLDPTGKVPGTVDIHVEFHPRRNTTEAAAGLLVAVEGGPGYPSTGTRHAYKAMYGPLLDQRDLLLIDARGTGRSGVINCPRLQDAPEMTERNVARCGQLLGDTAPLYSTALAADDMAAVLDALGVDKIDLYGDSYGTWFGQVFAYRHPTRLRSLVLDSAYPVPMVGGETPWYPFFASTMREEFNLVCARSPDCAALPGDSMSHIAPALALLRTAPFTATARDATGRSHTFTADASMLATVMLAGAPPYAVARELDAAARAFTAGDRLPLLRLMAETLAFKDARDRQHDLGYYSVGMYAAVTCQDYAQVYDMTLPPAQRREQRDRRMAQQEKRAPELYAPFTISEFRGLPLDYSLLDACVSWPAPSPDHPPGPPVPPQPNMPHIPVLVLSGEIDTITTPPEGAIVASLFPQATHVVVANSFHLTASPPQRDPCGMTLVRRFITTLDPGDTSCAGAVAPLRTPPRFAAQVADVPAAQALPGNRANDTLLRAAAAAALTLGDATARLESAGPHSIGLRGGSFTVVRRGTNNVLSLDALRWTEDLAVSGTLRWPQAAGMARATVQLQGPNGLSGQLDLRWPEQQVGAQVVIRGTLNGQRVAAQMNAP